MRRVVLLLVWCCVAGCETQTRVVRDSWAGLEQYADPKPTGEDYRKANDPGRRGWTLRVARFEGEDRHGEAYRLIETLRERMGLAEVWVEDDGRSATVYHGRWRKREDPRAQTALEQLQKMAESSKGDERLTRAMAGLAVLPVAELAGGGGASDPLDARQYAGKFTVQVAAFNDDFPGDRRAGAEQYARELREQGHEAYFYHGPRFSLVTLGIFDENDWQPRKDPRGFLVDVPGSRMQQLMQDFPYNRINGIDLAEQLPEAQRHELRSRVFRII